MMVKPLILALGALSWAGLTSAQAQTDLFSPETLSAYADVRLSWTDGEPSWTQSGVGKTRFGEGESDISAHLAEAGVVWRPRLSWSVTGYAHLQFNDDQDEAVGLVEGFVRYQPVPRSAWRWSGRAGVFYPPISLEHEENAWATRYTLTPSALNSWIGEEIKGTGIEARVEREVSGHLLAATGGVFGYNDTTAVMLFYRGWATHDIKSTARAGYDLTLYPGHVGGVQPFEETDDRPGYYLRLDWSPRPGLDFNLTGWDNNADLDSRNSRIRAWLTRFVNAGATFEIDDQHTLIAQALSGTSYVGRPGADGRRPIDLRYSTAYVMAVRERGAHIWAVRAEAFETQDRSTRFADSFEEHGWSGAASWRYQVNPNTRLGAEVLHVNSDRPLRQRFGGTSHEAQTQLQISVRLSL